MKAALLLATLRDAKGTTHCDRGISCDVDLTIKTLDDDHGDSLTLHSGRNVFEGHRESCQILGHRTEARCVATSCLMVGSVCCSCVSARDNSDVLARLCMGYVTSLLNYHDVQSRTWLC